MTLILSFIILGLVAGSVYGLAATGLVLTYKTSGILNLAHGAIAACAVYAFYALWITAHLPWPVAMLVSVGVVGPASGLGMSLLAKRIASAGVVAQIAATVGVILIVEGATAELYGQNFVVFPSYLPTSTFKVLSDSVSYEQLIVVVVSVLAAGSLWLVLSRTKFGLLARAVVDSPELLGMSGTDPGAVRRWSWVIGSTFASLSGVLLAPTVSLDATVLIFLVITAFGAAAIGRFQNLVWTFVGGLVIGVLGALSTHWVSHVASLGGLPSSIPFIVLFVVLLATPRRHWASREAVRGKIVLVTGWRAPIRARLAGTGLAVCLLALVPAVVSDPVAWTTALSFVILFLSLGLLVKVSAQVSLCQLGLAGVGGAIFVHLTNMGIPWALALVFAGLLTIPAGAIVAIPAIRLSGVFLALATIGFGYVLEQMAFSQSWLFGTNPAGLNVRRPFLGVVDLSSDTGFYYVVLAVVIVAVGLLIVLTETRLGRLLRAMADSPLALESLGTNVSVVRVVVFCISAFLAGVSGAVFGANISNITGNLFTTAASLTLVAVLVIQPGAIPWYAIAGAVGYSVIPGYFPGSQEPLTILFGVSAVAVAATGHSGRLPRPLQDAVERVFGRTAPVGLATVSGPPDRAPVARSRRESRGASREGLSIRDLSVRYGGNVAVRDLSLTAPVGRITALIGPNGAGKTSTFNACSGLLQPSSGIVKLHGLDVGDKDPATRARQGLGRTFQRIELFDSLTVRQNLRLGREAGLAGGNPLRQVVPRRREMEGLENTVRDAASVCGIRDLLEVQAGVLSTGQRRLVEVARCVVGGFDLLLLDEPSSGLDRVESERFGPLLRCLIDAYGVGILLVEHDVPLVMSVADYIYVLDFGVLLFEGTPAEVAASPAVQAAYLGNAETSPTSAEVRP